MPADEAVTFIGVWVAGCYFKLTLQTVLPEKEYFSEAEENVGEGGTNDDETDSKTGARHS